MNKPTFPTTLVDVLRQRALEFGDKLAFSFLQTHDGEEVSVSYRELHERAMAIGGELQSRTDKGERALLLYPPGLDFIAAFFGCLYAGVVAVPVSPPRRNRSTSSLAEVFHASEPALILSTAAHWKQEQQTYTKFPGLLDTPAIATDEIDDSRRHVWCDPQVDGDHLAFLQYTSGSTSTPKGVMVSHGNLLDNSKLIHESFGSRAEGWGVSWLPLHHDMGLIGGMIQPLYCGGSSTLLAPAAFLQRPMLWLEAISRTRSIISGGPDFAYELCARKITPAERERLDLSCWEVAFTGAEPIRARTLDHFVEAFSSCGFRREMFYPCYGLAECTLIVSGGPRLTTPKVVHIDPVTLAHNDVHYVPENENGARSFVGSGVCLPGQHVVIANPDTHAPCPDRRVGEIWVQGPSVAQGYYGLPEATEASFRARLTGSDEGPFLRTGDLGFLEDGQLYVTGRLKDLIIIRGRNYYPQDIEHSVERAHDAFRLGHCAALATDDGDQEQLVIVQEIEPRHRDLDTDAAIEAIRHAVAAHHELEIHAIVLAKAGALPKTTSGKTRRFAARELYLSGQLKARAEWKDESLAFDHDPNWAADGPAPQKVTSSQLEQWLIERLGARLKIPRDKILVTKPFADFGMSSLDAVEISADLEKWLGRSVSPTAVYNYPNIVALAQWLASPPAEPQQPATHVATSKTAGQTVKEERESLEREVRGLSDKEMEAFLLREMSELEKD